MSGSLFTAAEAFFYVPTRQIGGIIPDCAIEEDGIDELEITKHPVEVGAAITDHIFKNPANLILRWSWSNSGIGADGTETYVQEIYSLLLQMQVSGEFLTVFTGKRAYVNILIHSIAQHTDSESEYALQLIIDCEQVIVVETVAAPAPMQNGQQGNQAAPQQTAPQANVGQQTAPQKPSSVLNDMASSIANI